MDKEIAVEDMFVQEAVTLIMAPNNSAINTIGVLSFGKDPKRNLHVFKWQAMEMCEIQEAGDWAIVHRPAAEVPSTSKHPRKDTKPIFIVLYKNLKGVEFDKNELRLLNLDMSTHSRYLFNEGSPYSLVDYLERNQYARRSARRHHFYHFFESIDNEKLQKSIAQLSMGFLSRLANVCQILPLGKQPDEDEEMTAPRPPVHRREPLDAKQWASFQTASGMIMDVNQVKHIIYRGGITADIRAEVWKYLLGYDRWYHTTAERTKRRQAKRESYSEMKLQWSTRTPRQESNHADYRAFKHAIAKSIEQMDDESYDFYFAGDENGDHRTTLREILMTNIMYNFNLGYAHGMHELVAPILCLMEDQPETFWCFVGLLKMMPKVYDLDQNVIKEQREDLRSLLLFVNPKFYHVLVESESENMYFCLRWLMVWLKYEFPYPDILELWDVLLTGQPCRNFHLFVCVAILDMEMDAFMEGPSTFEKVIGQMEELSGNLNVKAVLERAEAIYRQVTATLESTMKAHVEIRKIIAPEEETQK